MPKSTGLVLGATLLAVAGIFPGAVAAASKSSSLTQLVKTDFSDCMNSNVSAAPPAVIGGQALVTRRDGGQTEVNVRLTKAAPNTTYHMFLKCHHLLGDIKTDADGKGSNTFLFPTKEPGEVFAFDMYPDGAPLGNKYQSVTVSFQ
jgi:hypothetical protein